MGCSSNTCRTRARPIPNRRDACSCKAARSSQWRARRPGVFRARTRRSGGHCRRWSHMRGPSTALPAGSMFSVQMVHRGISVATPTITVFCCSAWRRRCDEACRRRGHWASEPGTSSILCATLCMVASSKGARAGLPRRSNPHMHLLEAALAWFEVTGEHQHLDRATRDRRRLRQSLRRSRAIDARRILRRSPGETRRSAGATVSEAGAHVRVVLASAPDWRRRAAGIFDELPSRCTDGR